MFALSCAAALGLAFSERPETRRQLGGMAVNLDRYLLDRGYDIRELADHRPLMTKILLYMGNTVGSDRDKADAFAGRCYRRFG